MNNDPSIPLTPGSADSLVRTLRARRSPRQTKKNVLTQKPRADAILKTLPEEQQLEIVDYGRDHTLYATVKWLAAKGVKSSTSAISKFLSWSAARQHLIRIDGTVTGVIEQLKKERPDWTQEQLDLAGQLLFTSIAIKNEDSFSWKRVQDARAKKKSLDLQEKRLQIAERKEQAKSDAETAQAELTEAEKQAEYRRLFGGR